MKSLSKIALFSAAAVVLAGCADINFVQDSAELCTRGVSGFWWGLWNGIIAPFSFIGSLFDADIAIYDVCNNGGWYDFGFCLGIGAFSTGSHKAAARGSRTNEKTVEITDVHVDVKVETKESDDA